MSTLTDFLLARIAEEEDDVRSFMHDPEVRLPVGWITRLLAECDAKRRIVEACTVERENWVTVRPGVRENRPVREPYVEDDTAVDVLHLLTLPYADHPDYAEATR